MKKTEISFSPTQYLKKNVWFFYNIFDHKTFLQNVAHIAQNIAETCLKYFRNIFVKYCKIFHCNIKTIKL